MTCRSASACEIIVVIPRQLAHGESVSQRDRRERVGPRGPARTGLHRGSARPRIEHRPLRARPGDRVRPVKHHDRHVRPRRRAHGVHHRRHVRPGARSHILQIDHQDVDPLEDAVRRRQHRRTIQRIDRDRGWRGPSPPGTNSRSSCPRMPCSGENSTASCTPARCASGECVSKAMSDVPARSTPVWLVSSPTRLPRINPTLSSSNTVMPGTTASASADA